MKKRILITFLLIISLPAFSQIFNCNTDFFTITVDGYIQRWSLSNGAISGGDTILSGGGTSLAYCGDINSPTFYTNNFSQPAISYYDSTTGWISNPTYTYVDNGGGYLNDQYYQVLGAVIQVIKYWDGINLTTVDSLNGEFFAGTHDIAVDTLGRAWVFTGASPSNVDSLKVYDQTGQLNAYSIHYSQTGYGSFFLNDTLYIGTVEDSIYPVILTGNMAQLGIPIPFPANSFTDMASCQRRESVTSVPEQNNLSFSIYPNPGNGIFTLPENIEPSNVFVYNSAGKDIMVNINGRFLNLSNQASGVYSIVFFYKGKIHYFKVIKL